MTTVARPTADRGGIDIVDRRSGRRVTEVVLGDRWMRLAYAAPLVLLGESIFDHDLDRATVVGATVLVLLVAVGLAYRRIKRT